MTRQPFTTVRDLIAANLDRAEILAGYDAGYAGEPEPGEEAGLGFWHGWRNGSVDGGHREPDEAHHAMTADSIAKIDLMIAYLDNNPKAPLQ